MSLSFAVPGTEAYFLDLSRLAEGDVATRVEESARGPGWLLFSQPCEILGATRLEQVSGVVARAAEHAEGGGFAAGFLGYEAGPAFDGAIEAREPEWPVRAWFALYSDAPRFFRDLVPVYEDVPLRDLRSDFAYDRYEAAFRRVKEALAAGESYQVNLTFRLRFGLDDTPERFFASRCGVRPPTYATFVHGGDWKVASFSPELFFEREGERIAAKPMKGTAVAGTRDAADRLAEDPKTVAENIMIVDMVRSDLGAVAQVGSVEATELLRVEKHRNLLQMVSVVTGRSAAPTGELLRRLFPAASITGAPKVAASRIIREIETSPRHVYCGAIGTMGPGWQRFNVAIRTALFRGGEGEFGVGGGIVWDSEPEAEWAECLAKRDRLLGVAEPWRLVEAIPGHRLGEPEVVERHLARLREQARRFCVVYDEGALRGLLSALPPSGPAERNKVRMTLDLNGRFEIARGPSAVTKPTLTARLARRPVCSQDVNLRVKTTSRAVLDAHLDENPDVDEVLLYNEAGLLTEFCRGNVVVGLGERLLTPRPEAGCLEGLGVRELVEQGRVAYADLPAGILSEATALYFVNSVAGIVPVGLDGGDRESS